MVQLTVPRGGLTLPETHPSKIEGKNERKPLQIMQLDLADGLVEEIIKSSRHGGKGGVNVQFGKVIQLHYGNKSQQLTSTPFPSHSQLYDYPPESPSDLTLTGRISHKLAIQKTKEVTAGADDALAKLQSQMASHKQAKQSTQIKYVPDSSKLPSTTEPTAAKALKQQAIKTNPRSFLKPNHNRGPLAHDTTRSMPTSPSLGAAHPSLTPKLNPTSTPSLPNGKVQRLQAVRTPLIHFLAARPASAKLLAQHLACKQDEILELLQKVGKRYRLDETKWDLTDRTFKELDVWSFPYPNQEDRDLAIGRARSAFDRMRLSTQEKIWDKLLPKNERGKGKILSQLNLHKGPIQQSSTPKIQIQHSMTEECKVQHSAGEESDQKDRLAPSDAEPMARSKSHGSVKRTKVSEKEAQSKRLLSNGPKKVVPESKVKETHPAIKKGAPPQKKITPKSSEFVNDSDEEDGLEDAVANSLVPQEQEKVPKATKPVPFKETKSKPSTPSHSSSQSKSKAAVHNGKEIKPNKKQPMVPSKAPEKKNLPSGSSSPGSTAMKKTLSRQRTTSSPHKPSPLGSSPPTNASDLEAAARSSKSSTPIVAQAHGNNGTPNGVGLGIEGQIRKKRKAEDMDPNHHRHSSPVANGSVNGHVISESSSVKRQKVSEEQSPSSNSSGSPTTHELVLGRAEDFKKYYARYKKQYIEIAQMGDAPQEKVDALIRMHQRLSELKGQITIGLVGDVVG